MHKISFRSGSLILIAIIAFNPGLVGNNSFNSDRLTLVDNPLVLLSTVEVGGIPNKMVVDHMETRNDVAFYDESNHNLYFLDAGSLNVSASSIYLETWWWDGWLLYDRHFHRIYMVSTRTQWNNPDVSWKEARIHVIENHTVITSALSVNKDYNYGLLDPPDVFYQLHGVVLKQPNSEGINPARLILDNNMNGTFDVVDLNSTGDGIAMKQRASYRSPLGDPPWNLHHGNSLALETNYETLATEVLTTTDILYNSDANYTNGHIHVMQINHPLQPLGATALPDIDFSATWPFGDGQEDIQMAAVRDRLYVATGVQSFATGYLGRLNTTNNNFNVINLTYGDASIIHVDWSDTNRVFVTTCDGFTFDPFYGRYLHLIYDQTVISSLKLVDNCYLSENEVRDMVYDPYNHRLYLTMGTKILVVKVNYGSSPPPLITTPKAWLPIVRK